ncbi:MAG: DNA polymerase III subunit gamma/tau [Leptolyngbyaceae cyanobacterium bins.302]|nr:DNA polymerase III subunit gamma/tau [Leptolyngbyaceae cyanobacterium bins.302]
MLQGNFPDWDNNSDLHPTKNMTTALHLAYRPQTLKDLVGQPTIQTTLSNAITQGRIAPAYLFTGPRGTGKTSTARIFAKSLNCLSDDRSTLQPCGQCQSCRSIEVSSSLDVTEIDAASHNGVDDARELTQRVHLAPVLGRYRIVIVDECHQLTNQAQNALLKCVEEPPNHVVFILCTTEAHKVLPTIASRCQRFEFRALAVKTIMNHLRSIANTEAIEIGDEALMAIARLCDGGLRDALQLLAQVRLLSNQVTASQVIELAGGIAEGDLLTLVESISAGDTFGLLQTARHMIDGGKSPKLILSSLLQIYRDLLIVQSAPSQRHLLTSSVSSDQLQAIAQEWSYEAIQVGLAQLHTSEGQLRFSTNAQVWLEVCLLNLLPKQAIKASTPSMVKTLPQNNGNGHSSTDNLWQTIIDAAPGNAKSLLSRARLQQFDGSVATLLVGERDQAKFDANTSKIARLIQKAAGISQPVTLEFKLAIPV